MGLFAISYNKKRTILGAEISTDIDPPPLSIAEANLSGAEETYEAHLALRRARARVDSFLLVK